MSLETLLHKIHLNLENGREGMRRLVVRPSKEMSTGMDNVQEGGALGRLVREGEGVKDPQLAGQPDLGHVLGKETGTHLRDDVVVELQRGTTTWGCEQGLQGKV